MIVGGDTAEAPSCTLPTAAAWGPTVGVMPETSARLLLDAFDRVRDSVHRIVDGLTPEQLAFRPDASGNSIAWLIWHLTRIQDDHLARAGAGASADDSGQVWAGGGWFDRFGLPFRAGDTGYGHRPTDVAAVRVSGGDLLAGYHDAVHAQTTTWVAGLGEADYDRIVDEAWDPPVTLGVRLISVVNDDLQHVGQAAYVRGLLP